MNKNVDWDSQRAFLAVMETGSLSAAARRLGLSQPTMRARIEGLEAALGTALFTRSVHGLVPTPTAEAMIAPARAMAHASEAMLRAASADSTEAAGRVRLSVSEFVGIEVLPPMLRSLRDKHPRLTVELELDNASADLLDQQVDVAVRMHPPEQSALVARKVPSIPLGLFAHRDYLAAHGRPASKADTGEHLFIGPDRRRGELAIAAMFGDPARIRWIARTDSHPAQLALARAGVGIAVAQIPAAARYPELEQVLPDIELPQLPTWIVAHETLRPVPRVAALFDHLVETFDAYGKGKRISM
ncbi:LysR family transcriptional regulator [Prosthecodimorpha staleyi]|uniref:LysR family transcriptional regulator n=1 Tax=Prosthecodimorpha staleyi TaxID=2840188 RepID=A0A947GEX6_9HYPH|nr:LysR family transcriptional regulator [Prosthecodimorpha staleyi]MBT9292502.1 LysR family transcriptional regulator [Prosthecodimorpha staleyi]